MTKQEKQLDKLQPCFCVGPQRGEPFCPCNMQARGIFKRGGHWIEPAKPERDLGPVCSPTSLADLTA